MPARRRQIKIRDHARDWMAPTVVEGLAGCRTHSGHPAWQFPGVFIHADVVFKNTVIARAEAAGSCKIQGLSHLRERWEFLGSRFLSVQSTWQWQGRNRSEIGPCDGSYSTGQRLGSCTEGFLQSRIGDRGCLGKLETDRGQKFPENDRVPGGRKLPAVLHSTVKFASMQAETDRAELGRARCW